MNDKYTWKNGWGDTEWYDSSGNPVKIPKRFYATLDHSNEDVFVIPIRVSIQDMGASWDSEESLVLSVKTLQAVDCLFDREEEVYRSYGKGLMKVYLRDIRDVGVVDE